MHPRDHHAARGQPGAAIAGLALLAVAIPPIACAADIDAQLEPPPTQLPEPEPEPSGGADPTPCGPIELAELEASKPPPDPRSFDLAQLFPAAEPGAVDGPRSVVRLGQVAAEPVWGDPAVVLGIGMGWQGLEAAWVEDGISKDLRPALADWSAAWSEVYTLQRRAYLLDGRSNELHNLAPPEDPSASDTRAAAVVPGAGAPEAAVVRPTDPKGAAWDLRCVLEARGQTAAAAEPARRRAEAATGHLRSALEARADRLRGAEKVLLAYLEERQGADPPASRPASAGRIRELAGAVAADAGADRELRARAAELLARAYPNHDPRFAAALEQTAALTADPELRADALEKLAQIADDPELAARRWQAVIDALAPRPGDPIWTVAMAHGQLAELAIARGDYVAARDHGLACARLGAAEIDEHADPWGCAWDLAEALAELGPPAPGSSLPLSYLGPLAAAMVDAALARYDRATALSSARLALEATPLTPEAPYLAARLGDEAPGPIDVGPDSPWWIAQQQRLARRHPPGTLAQTIERLAEHEARPIPPPPEAGDDSELELHERATSAVTTCADTLDPGARVRVRVTTGTPVPAVAVGSADRGARECLRRAVAARFRALPPATVHFTATAAPPDDAAP